MANYTLGTLTSTPISRNGYSVTPQDATDVFKFTVGTSKVNLSLNNIRGGDADLALYRENGNGVFDSSDPFVASSTRGGNVDDSINRSVGTGTYFARVNRYAPTSSNLVRYDLDLSSTPDPQPSNLLPKETQVGTVTRDVCEQRCITLSKSIAKTVSRPS
ncbi:PPC domain-containing protein [Leptolyngbya sp. FACHB-541]|uniref:PPC domain-containing protein n=1 Tax=Leptolyngbya sp. FACHB-541 TaxID=2692810 RepID=UPI00168933A2|nr:PPC domain-containing protein [Leptolyngbya sp. FACHB-541]MBD2001142.1 PPC domain-containing protein [Leptolyngbya sp. FACHB-541]